MNDVSARGDRSLAWAGAGAGGLAAVLAAVLANDAGVDARHPAHPRDGDCPRHLYLTYWMVGAVTAGTPLVRVLLNAGTPRARSSARVVSLYVALMAGTVLSMRLMVLGAPRTQYPSHWALDVTTHLLVPAVGVAQWASRDIGQPSLGEVTTALAGVCLTVGIWAAVASDRWMRTGAFVYRTAVGESKEVLAAVAVAMMLAVAGALAGALYLKRAVTGATSLLSRWGE